MTALPPYPSSLSLAKESLAMSEKTGDKHFQRMAIGLMALTGIGTLLHLCHEILRDLKPKREKGESGDSNRPHGRPASPPREETPEHAEGTEHRASWVHKARVGERADSPRAWTEHAARPGHARQH